MLSRKNFISVALLSFGIFFGAGNLMFPPAVAHQAGTNVWLAFLGFFITAVALPVLGIVSVAKTEGLLNLGKKVDPIFAYIITIGILIAIGPGLAIPRTAVTSFQMSVRPYITDSAVSSSLLIYSILYFALVGLVAWSPNKIVDRIGRITTPALLVLIATMTLIVKLGPAPQVLEPSGNYTDQPVLTGFLAGYNTLDTLAGLNYGLLIVTALRNLKVKEDNIVSMATKTGLVAGSVLTLVYFCLTLIGQVGAGNAPEGANGADILLASSQSLLGTWGTVLFGAIFVLACFNTCVGLVTSISQFFAQIIPQLSYKTYVIILTLWSLALANIGLDGILAYSVPVLVLLYPIGITLIILSLTEARLGHTSLSYKIVCYLVFGISIVSTFTSLGIIIPVLSSLVSNLPLANLDLAWVLPAFIAFVGVSAYTLSQRKNKAA